MSDTPVVVLFRQDLRLIDNPALHAAAQTGQPALPVFIWHPFGDDWPLGTARRWWLRKSLLSLQDQLRKAGSKLLLFKGDPATVLEHVCHDHDARQVFLNRRYDPSGREADQDLKESLEDRGITCSEYGATLLFEPWNMGTKKDGSPFKVFTPFYNAVLERLEPVPPIPATVNLATPETWPQSLSLDDFEDLPATPPDGHHWDAFWEPGEKNALKRVGGFLDEAIEEYPELRDRPDLDLTSRFSSYLANGEISLRMIQQALMEKFNCAHPADLPEAAAGFYRELIWREFGYHLLYHFPHTDTEPLNPKYADFPWVSNYEKELQAWKRGQTGYPLVDAGMRQLNSTGWMHNRVRMVVASFLTKHLLIPWQEGAKYFWETLIDADLASNSLNWQWAAGSGADAAPYWRIFNPTRQAERFDPDGVYIVKWCPELNRLPKKAFFAPWTASALVLERAHLKLGKDYPEPIIDHNDARERALAAYEMIRR